MPDKLDDTIKTDINNLLVVTQERKRSNDSTISFITTDKRLIRWAAAPRPWGGPQERARSGQVRLGQVRPG